MASARMPFPFLVFHDKPLCLRWVRTRGALAPSEGKTQNGSDAIAYEIHTLVLFCRIAMCPKSNAVAAVSLDRHLRVFDCRSRKVR